MQRRDLIKLSMMVLGSCASLSVSRALMAGVSAKPDTRAHVFNPPQQTAVNLLAEMIIPTTDTPGALAAGVPDFIASIVADWYTGTERDIFFQGLVALDNYCQTHTGKLFSRSDEATRIAALTEQEQVASKYQAPAGRAAFAPASVDENAPFFTKLKELVVLGYYTSEIGCTQELVYLPMPGEFNGDYDFAKVGRQWSS